jgi:hypothetical protein
MISLRFGFEVMKNFAKSLCLFIPFSIGVYVLFIAIWENYAPYPLKRNLNIPSATGHMCSRMKDIEDVKDIDIFF